MFSPSLPKIHHSILYTLFLNSTLFPSLSILGIKNIILYNLFSSVQSHPALCYPMYRTTPGLPVHHQPESLRKLMSIASVIPSHPLSSPSPPAFNLSQHQSFFPVSWFFVSGGQNTGVSASASVLPMNIQD